MKAQQIAILLAAALAAASMWFYFDRILVGYQLADAVAHARPRGNLSDLYPRWVGAKELLQHRTNPYGDGVTREIQKGYYGRELDPSLASDPKDRQGFAYPVYVVFLLAPLIGFSFHSVQLFFFWTLLLSTAASVLLWLRALHWSLGKAAMVSLMLFALGSLPALQGLKLQQLSLLVAALLASASACVAGGLFFLGGALLALATIKPQLAWPLVCWLLLWALGNWRSRRNLAFGFGFVMLLLLGGAEILLPGWLRMFVEAIRQYRRYTQSQSVLDASLPWAFAGKIAAVLAILISVKLLWRVRFLDSTGLEFGSAIALVTAVTVLVVPMYAPYNQVLLLPSIVMLVRDRAFFLSHSRAMRFVYVVGALAVAWQWIASLGLSVLYFVSKPLALSGWKWPFYSTFAIPVLIFALSLTSSRVQARAARETEETLPHVG